MTLTRVAFEHAQVDTEARTLEREGRRVRVEPKAFELLVYLIEHRDRVATSEELLDALWPGISVAPTSLSRAVHKARQAVGDDGERQAVLRTVHGYGFQFVAEISEVAVPGAAVSPAARRSRARWIAAGGVAAVLLAAASFWLLKQPAAEAAPGHTLAVLSLVNMSPEPDQAYFAEGIAEDVRNTVAHFEGLRVVGRKSSEVAARKPESDAQTIGEKLGADVILEGSVRTEGDQLRITAQLVDAEDGVQLWSESYDRELKDVLAIQTEIATAIATALRIELSSEERQRLARPPTENLAAYQAYLLGRQQLAKFRTATTQEAIADFEKAIELDPKLAVAYVGLTEGHLEQIGETGLLPDDVLARAQATVDMALKLDDRSAEAHAALGRIRWYSDDLEGAEAAYQRALLLNPGSVSTYHHYGNLLGLDLARYEEALALHRKAVELDPLSPDAIQHVGEDLEWLGRFDEGLSWLERAVEIDPDYAWGNAQIGLYHWFVSGRLDEAVVWWAKAFDLTPVLQAV